MSLSFLGVSSGTAFVLGGLSGQAGSSCRPSCCCYPFIRLKVNFELSSCYSYLPSRTCVCNRYRACAPGVCADERRAHQSGHHNHLCALQRISMAEGTPVRPSLLARPMSSAPFLMAKKLQIPVDTSSSRSSARMWHAC